MNLVWRLREDSCTGCGICRDVCPDEALSMPPDIALPQPVPGACTGCGGCVAECPFDAIIIELAAQASDGSLPAR